MLAAIRQKIGLIILLVCARLAYVALRIMGSTHFCPGLIRKPGPEAWPAPHPAVTVPVAQTAFFH